MKKIVLVLGLLFIFSANSLTQQNYFPLEVGNYWQYRATHYSSLDTPWVSYDYIEVLGDTLLGVQQNSFKKVKLIILSPFYFDTLQYLKYDSTINSILEFHTGEDTATILFKFDAQISECWWAWYKEICYTSLDTIEIFGNTKLNRHYHGGNIPSFTYDLTEGFGPIRIIDNQSYVITSYAVYELVYAKINGIEYGQFVSVDDENLDLPSKFYLSQNFPNPFNPSTKISWQSLVSGWQTLKVYDVLGNEVATLVNEYRSAGSYEIEFNLPAGSQGPESSIKHPASGIFFYRLQAGDYVETKKMVLLR